MQKNIYMVFRSIFYVLEKFVYNDPLINFVWSLCKAGGKLCLTWNKITFTQQTFS